VSLAARPRDERLSRGRARAVAARIAAPAPAGAVTRYEGLVTRTIAFAVDAALINVVAIAVAAVVALAVSVLGIPSGTEAVLVALGGPLFLIWTVAYFATFWSTTGQTPGNRLLEIRVCRANDGSILSPRRSVLRLACLALAAIPLFAGFLPILVDNRRRGLHDMLAGTVVVSASPQVDPSSG
jgi:uncharacterized RDD family membrane protein YckC